MIVHFGFDTATMHMPLDSTTSGRLLTLLAVYFRSLPGYENSAVECVKFLDAIHPLEDADRSRYLSELGMRSGCSITALAERPPYNSSDEDAILALAEPTGDFHAGVRVQKTFFHTSWDLKIINTVDLRAFLLVLERNVIQPSPGAAGIGLLAPMTALSSAVHLVDSQPSDPLMVCSFDGSASQLLAVEAELPPSEAEKLRTVIDQGLSAAADKHGQYHTEQLRSVGQMYQKIQEEAQHSAAAQLKAVENRLAEFKQAQAEASSKFVDGQRHELAA